MPLVSLYICVSEDGFIADKSGGVGWLPPMGPDAQKNYEKFFDSIDTLIMGSRSYEKIISFGMDWPYAGKLSYVFSHQERIQKRLDRNDVIITSEDPKSFMERLNNSCPEVKKIWLMGGAELTKSFAELGLIDEISLFTVPKSLSQGIPLSSNILQGFDKTNEGQVGELQFQEYTKKK